MVIWKENKGWLTPVRWWSDQSKWLDNLVWTTYGASKGKYKLLVWWNWSEKGMLTFHAGKLRKWQANKYITSTFTLQDKKKFERNCKTISYMAHYHSAMLM